MKISFVITSSKQNFKPFKNQPLGALYLLTILEKEFGNKLDLSLIDLRSINHSNAIYHVPKRDVYFYSVTSIDYADTQKIVSDIRKFYPESKHIAGGPHVEIFPEESLKIFDSISLGEGEESIKRIIGDLFNSDLKKVYKQEEKIDINAYPYPERKYLPDSAVADKGILGGEYSNLIGTTVLFSRGCPFKCYFCANQVFGGVRFRSPELIIEEIEYLKKEYHIEAIAIKDDNSIPVNVNIARPFLDALAKTGVKWRGQSRANGVHPDMVKLAKKSGCVEISVGIESVSQKVLDVINKKIDLKLAEEYLEVLKKEGINRRLLLILGLPGEPDDIAEQTIDFIKKTQPSSVLLSFFQPMPGSEIYKNPEKFGIKINPKVSFDDYVTAFGRFDANEKPTPVYEYETKNISEKRRSIAEIREDYIKVQKFLRENGFNY